MIFNGFYTLLSPSGDHRTFRVATQSKYEIFAPGKRIISMLVGPNNEFDYEPFGFVEYDRIRIFKNKRTDFFSRCSFMLESLAENGEESPYYRKGVRVLLDKRCMKYNRKLTHPTSIDSGIGPECSKQRKLI